MADPVARKRPARIPTIALIVMVAGCASPAGTPSMVPTDAAPSVTPSPTIAPTPSAAGSVSASPEAELTFVLETYAVRDGSHPHDVAPAADGGIWYTGQGNGTLGWLDPQSGEVVEIDLAPGSAPHGVITGPDDAAWVTDGGLNAIVRVDGTSHEVTTYRLDGPNVNLNTATFDGDDILWFTGQQGAYGSLDPRTGEIVLHAVEPGPYGIATTPDGEVYFSSLAGSYLGRIDRGTGEEERIETPTPGGGARRVWSDSRGRLWVTEWFSGSLAMYDPDAEQWQEFALPSEAPMPYAVFVDEHDAVWVSDHGANALHRFDPELEEWRTLQHESAPAEVRQLLGRPGEVWGAESAADQLVVVRTEP